MLRRCDAIGVAPTVAARHTATQRVAHSRGPHQRLQHFAILADRQIALPIPASSITLALVDVMLLDHSASPAAIPRYTPLAEGRLCCPVWLFNVARSGTRFVPYRAERCMLESCASNPRRRRRTAAQQHEKSWTNLHRAPCRADHYGSRRSRPQPPAWTDSTARTA